MKPTKCSAKEKKMRQEKQKQRREDKAKAKAKTLEILLSAHAQTSQYGSEGREEYDLQTAL